MQETKETASDRRPIPAREHKASRQVAHFLASAGVTPNAISVAGLFAGCAGGLAIAMTSVSQEHRTACFLGGALLILCRLLANMFDGMVAVLNARPNPLGELYNEIPDRLTDAATLIGCGYSINSSPAAGYVAAVFAIMTAYVRSVGKVAGAPYVFAGPFAKQQRMFLCIFACLWVAVFPGLLDLSLTQSASTNGNYSVMAPVLWIIAVGSAITCVRRLFSIADHLQAKQSKTGA
ncbi:MAG: hypothetical protein RIQ81_338 [Pseudomonadota bacterium]|jgi:phosphatidylglycerophosphate synthase